MRFNFAKCFCPAATDDWMILLSHFILSKSKLLIFTKNVCILVSSLKKNDRAEPANAAECAARARPSQSSASSGTYVNLTIQFMLELVLSNTCFFFVNTSVYFLCYV